MRSMAHRSCSPTARARALYATAQNGGVMNRVRMAGVVGLIAALGISGFSGSLGAQQGLTIGGAASNFGQRSLAPGFMPDPVQIPIVSGGSINARTLNLGPGCVGNVTQRPDFILRMTGN